MSLTTSVFFSTSEFTGYAEEGLRIVGNEDPKLLF